MSEVKPYANYVPGDQVPSVASAIPPPAKFSNFYTEREAQLAHLNRQVGAYAEQINVADREIADATARLQTATEQGDKDAAQECLNGSAARKVKAEAGLAAVRAELDALSAPEPAAVAPDGDEAPAEKKAGKKKAETPAQGELESAAGAQG